MKFIVSLFFVCNITHCFSLPMIYSDTSNTLPNEVSFCVADLKFDGQNVKLCEFGEGVNSRFKGFDSLYGQGASWTLAWDFLLSFQTPVWFVQQGSDMKDKKAYGLDFLFDQGAAISVQTVQALVKDELFKKAQKKHQKSNAISHGPGIIIINSMGVNADKIRILRKHPRFLILSDVTGAIMRDKRLTNALFESPELVQYKPNFKVYKRKYSADLAQTIKNDLQCPIFVIKPTSSALGNGIIIVEQKDLDSTLKLILQDQDLIASLHKQDPTYTHWIKDKNSHFIVEEFATSRSILIDKKFYDPTLRVLFGLCNDGGRMGVCFFGCYWKLPAKALSEYGSLTDKHKSNISTHRGVCSAKVDTNDFEIVKALMTPMLFTVYEKMLKMKYGSEK